MAAETIGQATLRAENVEKIVTGFALQKYVGKQLVMSSSSNAWSESYFQESASELVGGTGSEIKGVPRLANFPYGEVNWTKQTGYQEKYGMEGVISWEDAISDNIDVIARTLTRLARAVANSVDTEIFSTLSDSWNASSTLINTVAVGAGYEWDSDTLANRNPIQDILNGIKEIQKDNYDPLSGEGYLAVSPTDFANLLGNANVRNAGQFYTDDVTRNGRVGKLLGVQVVSSNAVSDDYALIVCGKTCGTWKSAIPLTTATIIDAGVSYTIRAWEIGVCQLTNPNSVCLISNTQK